MYRTSIILAAAVAIGTIGCTGQSKSASKPTDKPSEMHDHGSSGSDDAHAVKLIVSTKPAQAQAGQKTTLSLMLHDAAGKMLKDLDFTHEKLAHLILIREGLDEFAHLHPEVDAQGNMMLDYTFPKGGKYYVFLDYQPKGGAAATAHQVISVAGANQTASPVEANVPGQVAAASIVADIDVERVGDRDVVTFELRDADGTPVTDLEQYLGAMGHLVVVSAEGTRYVHAHPLTETLGAHAIKFDVHFPGPGIYKLWGQFQRKGQVVTIPAVIKYEGSVGSHQHPEG